MTDSLSLVQRLTLAKWLAEGIGARRTKVMIPAAREEMPSGTRLAAMFGGKIAAWVVMPEAAQRAAYVDSPGRLLAWAKREHPEKVLPAVEVVTTDELIEHLRKHFPSALKTVDVVDPQWVSDLCSALRKPGHYMTSDGEKLTEVPGITLPDRGDATPTVSLTDDAETIIGEAWRSGSIPAAEVLALPGGETP